MQKTQGRSTPSIVDVAENACIEVLFVTHASCAPCVRNLIAHRPSSPKGMFADSESQIFATKKFSRPPSSRLNAARQIRFLARIATADSQLCFLHIA
jgi:hypothetical protein